jgi:hypothetical protein
MLKFRLIHQFARPEHVGWIPAFLFEHDPRPAKEQIDTNYQHGGGWHSMTGFKMDKNNVLKYPEDPPMFPIADAWLRDEHILIYNHAWVAIVQKDGSFDVARID